MEGSGRFLKRPKGGGGGGKSEKCGQGKSMDKGPGVGEHLESWGTGVRVKLERAGE